MFELVVRLKIKRKNFIDTALLTLMYLQLVILEFFGYGQTLNKIVSMLILLRLICLSGRQSQVILLRASGVVILYALSSLFSDTFIFANVMSNFLMQLYPFIYAYYIYFVCKNKPEFIDSLLGKCFYLFNITMIVNIVVMCIQITVPYSINAVNTNNTTSAVVFYEDLISGLFAYSSTHVVCLFTVFVVLYNLAYRKRVNNRTLQRMLLLYTAAIIAVSVMIALKNDNKAFFLLFPIAILVYWFAGGAHASREKFNRAVFQKKWNQAAFQIQKRLHQILLVICIILTILLVLYIVIPQLSEFLNDKIVLLFGTIGKAVSNGNSSNGSLERISMVFDAIARGSTWVFGTGFGCSHLYKSGYLGYNHFGQADLGALLFLGGIWYVALLFSCYLRMSLGIICGVKRKNNRGTNRMVAVCVFAILLCTMEYTQCFTRTNTVTSLMLIILALRIRYQSQLDRSPVKQN